VIGHQHFADGDEHQYAHGWVKGLRMDGSGKVYADVQDLTTKALHAIAEKNLRYVSAEIHEFDKWRDANEAPYLRAISLLERDTLAVQGTKLPTLFELGAGSVTTLDEKKHIAASTRRMSVADTRRCTRHKIPIKDESMDETEKLKAELAAKEAEFDAMKSAERKQEAETYFGKLRDSGKLTHMRLLKDFPTRFRYRKYEFFSPCFRFCG
jgi:hypothetical protein